MLALCHRVNHLPLCLAYQISAHLAHGLVEDLRPPRTLGRNFWQLDRETNETVEFEDDTLDSLKRVTVRSSGHNIVFRRLMPLMEALAPVVLQEVLRIVLKLVFFHFRHPDNLKQFMHGLWIFTGEGFKFSGLQVEIELFRPGRISEALTCKLTRGSGNYDGASLHVHTWMLQLNWLDMYRIYIKFHHL